MTAGGSNPFVAIPVFPSKAFRHSFICVNRQAGIREPKDLAGKRIGVNLFTITASIWLRGDLENVYGVDLSKRPVDPGSGREVGDARQAAEAADARASRSSITPNTSDKSLSEMLADGEIDAYLGSRMPDSVRTDPDRVAHLFPNFREEEKRYYQQYGIHPIMHLVAIRRDVYERDPWIAQSLFKAFVAARDWAIEAMYFSGAQRYMLPWLFDDLRELDEVFGKDQWAYGVDKNRATLETFVKYLHQQGFIDREVPVDGLFAPMHGRLD